MGLAECRVLNRAEIFTRKAAKRRRRDLERELADYDSPAQCDDFEATLDRFPDELTHELRDIIARQRSVGEQPLFLSGMSCWKP